MATRENKLIIKVNFWRNPSAVCYVDANSFYSKKQKAIIHIAGARKFRKFSRLSNLIHAVNVRVNDYCTNVSNF